MTKAFYTIHTSPPIYAEAEAPAKGISNIYVCPLCGEIWAQVLCTESEFFPCRRPCVLHSWASMVPGSILAFIEDIRYQGSRDYFVSLHGMPPAILAYELQVHMQDFEKGVLE